MNKRQLSKVITRRAKRIGRGQGSGRGKTSGRGTKGQNARGKLSITHAHYEGGQRPLIKRLPYKRGKGNPKISKKPIIVSLDALSQFTKGQVVNIESLIKNGIIKKEDAQKYGVKILGGHKLPIALTIELPISKKAAEKIEKAGGKITNK
ncbi:MAG: 50S ribosomal protein L15 [Candidatus Curtissbacteria bacterium GW2011_GWA1_40_9]|uniref:Large ribosomal subunit protein uL15 n=1 Tax=Candidatus Curtissbacteria bacterium GW2011_GWA1_40_9 TaxID=1618408 RepID=A0A0G0WRN6_9BACT|nr:MAG: 50S ribosomal protein L15 [Candidatus Curtissbacteria bacterium GW2011_GWA1_40_9]